jgi:hypothetical protein
MPIRNTETFGLEHSKKEKALSKSAVVFLKAIIPGHHVSQMSPARTQKN